MDRKGLNRHSLTYERLERGAAEAVSNWRPIVTKLADVERLVFQGRMCYTHRQTDTPSATVEHSNCSILSTIQLNHRAFF